MKTLFNEADYQELAKRVEALSKDARPQWGKMNVAQMLAHVNSTIEAPLGKIEPPSESNWFKRFIIKPIALSNRPIMKNAPTAKVHKMVDEKDFNAEKQRLLQNLKEMYERGVNGEYKPHVSFGPMTSEEWGILVRKHTDHHLSQFGE
jgi:tetrahydromethanopterin S-methyltransferase subunit G